MLARRGPSRGVTDCSADQRTRDDARGYLVKEQSPAKNAITADDWNRLIDAFDVTGLAAQLASIGAGYFFLTVGQGSGHYCAPNDTYDAIVGIHPSKCSRRDLIRDLAVTLQEHRIPLLVYTPSDGSWDDPVARERLGWRTGWTNGWNSPMTGRRLAEFQQRWEAVLQDWSRRWGRLVRGWWVDGCYFSDQMYRHPEPLNFVSFAAALRAGNPDALVAFNPGVVVPIICHTEVEDDTAGEIAEAFPVCPGRWVTRGAHQAQYHVLSYLGPTWCAGLAPRFPDKFVIGYT